MKILGIHSGHDAGAALIEDGRPLFCINEERLSRQKMHWGIPYMSIEEIFKRTDVVPGSIDAVAISGVTKGGGVSKSFIEVSNLKKLADMASFIPFFRTHLFKSIYLSIFRNFREEKELNKFLKKIGIKTPVNYVEHHLAHAASAYYSSPFKTEDEKSILIVTIDSSGDGLCSTLSEIKKGKISRLTESVFFNSPGAFYSYVTHNLGFKYGRHEGKITGLAAYGDPLKTLPIFKSLMDVDLEKLEFRSHLGCWGRPGAKKLHMIMQGYKREDIAAGAQKALEQVVASFIRQACIKFGKSQIAAAGGVFANVKLNQAISELPEVDDIYIHQNMGDGGLGLGSAQAIWAEKEASAIPICFQDAYLGPEFNNIEIEAALKSKGLHYQKYENVHSKIAEYLSEGKIVARFFGKMEYGPRALGHRSILYQTQDKTINDWLNKKLNRTEFMPFAPIILAERAGEYFKNFDITRAHAARFMTITYNVTEKCKADSPSITHIDGTARPQIVEQENNPDTYGILKAYESLSGKPILINTSFNMHEEPIVCTPEEAIDSFLASKLDVLAIGDFIVIA
jgi:carbamoyltransferase